MYEMAIRQILTSGIGRAVPELVHHNRINVFDEELVAAEHLKETPPSQPALHYPFVTFSFESERIAAGRNPPEVTKTQVVPSVNPNFQHDVLEIATYPLGIELRVEVYDELSEAGLERQRIVLNKLRNYFAMLANEEIDPVTGRLRGMWFAVVDPETGKLVSDAENPPQRAIRLHFSVTTIGEVRKTTTAFNIARRERRRAFTVWFGGTGTFVRRVPTINLTPIQIGDDEATGIPLTWEST